MRLKVSFLYDVTLTFRHNVLPPSSDIRTLVIAAERSSKCQTPPTHMTSSQWERQSCCGCLPVIGLCSEQQGNPAAFLTAGFRPTLPPPRPFRAYPMVTGISFLGVTFSLSTGWCRHSKNRGRNSVPSEYYIEDQQITITTPTGTVRYSIHFVIFRCIMCKPIFPY
jgi:hypothetical protein